MFCIVFISQQSDCIIRNTRHWRSGCHGNRKEVLNMFCPSTKIMLNFFKWFNFLTWLHIFFGYHSISVGQIRSFTPCMIWKRLLTVSDHFCLKHKVSVLEKILYPFFRFCPYYMARELRKEADLIFMPYNYVLDFKVSFWLTL